MNLDKIDRKILTALQRDGRASVEKIADIVGLSPTPTRRRIRRLEHEGAIKGYAAIVDPMACGLDLTLYVFIKLERRSRDNIDGFEKAIERLPEVVSCDLVTGPHDYLLIMHIASMRDYNHYLHEVIADIPGIVGIETSIVIGQIKRSRTLAL